MEDTVPDRTGDSKTHESKTAANDVGSDSASAPLVDDDGYYNEFEERLNSGEWAERQRSFDHNASGTFRRSTEEHLKMMRDEFYELHKDSIAEMKMIDEMAEYQEQMQLMKEMQMQETTEQQQNEQIQPSQQAQQQPEQILANIQSAMRQLQHEYEQHVNAIQSQLQPLVASLTQQMTAAQNEGDVVKMQLIQAQQSQTQQQFQAEVNALQQRYAPNLQQLQLSAAQIENALQLQQQQQPQVPGFIPSVPQSENAAQVSRDARPFIVDEHPYEHQVEILHRQQPQSEPTAATVDADGQPISLPMSISISADHQSQTQPPPQLLHVQQQQHQQPMSIPSYRSYRSGTKSPPVTVGSDVISHSAHTSPLHAPHATRSLLANFSSPLRAVSPALPSLADISRTPELTPETSVSKWNKRRRSKKTTSSGAHHFNHGFRSLPTSPFISAQRLKPRTGANNAADNGGSALKTSVMAAPLSPFVLARPAHAQAQPSFPDTAHANAHAAQLHNRLVLLRAHDTGQHQPLLEDEKQAHSEDEEKDSTLLVADLSRSQSATLVHSHSENELSCGESDDDDDAMPDEMPNPQNHPSLYSYSSVSTVFTGVHDGALLVNHAVQLSNVEDAATRTLAVARDIKTLWLQCLSTPLLLTLLLSVCIFWLSRSSSELEQIAGFLLGVVIFTMVGHLCITGMTSRLSTACDRLYAANCKPLIGIQLQKTLGFTLLVVVPMTCISMKFAACLLAYAGQPQSALRYMHAAVNASLIAVPPLAIFYVLQRYLQGAHVRRVNRYTAACLAVALFVECAILISYQSNPAFARRTPLLCMVLLSLVLAYWTLMVAFLAVAYRYKLHTETFIFRCAWKHLCPSKQWCSYLGDGLYATALLVGNAWYFDFMILLAGVQGLPQLVAFGLLCHVYHVVSALLSASEFVSKSLLFRGLLHSSIGYARQAWKWCLLTACCVAVLVGVVCYLSRHALVTVLCQNSEVQSLMRSSWLYVFAIIACDAVKYGLVGGAEAMNYTKLVASVRFLSFYAVSTPLAVWWTTLYADVLGGLHAIFISILVGNAVCIACLVVFRLAINWTRELDAFTRRTHAQAQCMQQSVEAVHIQLQQYKAQMQLQLQTDAWLPSLHAQQRRECFGIQCGASSHVHVDHTRKHRHHKAGRKHGHHRQHQCPNKQCSKHHHRRRRGQPQSVLRIKSNTAMPPLLSNNSNSSGSASAQSYGRMRVSSFNRQLTGDTAVTWSGDGPAGGGGSPRACEREQRDRVKLFEPVRRRRTFWSDLWHVLRTYCCRGDCQCAREWLFYCCGCCCSDDYDGYAGAYHALPRPYSNYHIDINNDKYQIIDTQPVQPIQNEEHVRDPQAIKLHIRNDELKQSLMPQHHESHGSMDGADAGYSKLSESQQESNQLSMQSAV